MRLMPAIALLLIAVPAVAPFITEITGTLHALTADSVHVRRPTAGADSEIVRVPRAAVIRFEYLAGHSARRSWLGLWALGGALAGVIIGGQTVRPSCEDMQCGLPPLVAGATIGAFAGLVTGSVLASQPREVWREY